MSQVGFEGTEIDALLAEDGSDSFSFYRVTNVRSSTMAYNTLVKDAFQPGKHNA